jgi:F-type H+-transporting ATPase subunit a
MEHQEVLQQEHEHTLYAEELFSLGPLHVTNALLTSWIAVIVIVVLSFLLRRKMKEVPGKLQQTFELISEGALTLCDQVTGNRNISIKVFPFAISIFFFVLINNWLGILPFTALSLMHDGHAVSILRSGTADLNTTLALGIIAVIASNIFGIFIVGIYSVINKYLNFWALAKIPTQVRKDPTVLIVAPIKFFVGIIEIIGEIAKVASLSFRLFGNVFAGEVLLAAMGALVAYVVPIPFLFLEILVGFIQALIFAMLTIVYFTISSQDHEAVH